MLNGARSRTVTWRLNAACSAGFTVWGTEPAALHLQDWVSDAVVMLEGVKLYRGRLVPPNDDIGTPHLVSCETIDYRGLLGRARVIWPDSTIRFRQIEAGAIAWTLVEDSQALDGGDWGITDGVGSTLGPLRDRTFDYGQNIGEAIQGLADVDDGFDWEVSPLLALNRWKPRGTPKTITLARRANANAIRRRPAPEGFGNAWLVSGAERIRDEEVVDPDIATAPQGRFESTYADPTIVRPDTLTQRGAYLLATSLAPVVAWEVDMRVGYWDPSLLWLGDTCQLAVKSGRLTVSPVVRLHEVTANLDENDVETVTLRLVEVPQ